MKKHSSPVIAIMVAAAIILAATPASEAVPSLRLKKQAGHSIGSKHASSKKSKKARAARRARYYRAPAMENLANGNGSLPFVLDPTSPAGSESLLEAFRRQWGALEQPVSGTVPSGSLPISLGPIIDQPADTGIGRTNVTVSVPDSSTTAGLLGIALLGLEAFRRIGFCAKRLLKYPCAPRC